MEKIKRNFGFGYMRLPMQGEEVDLEQTRKMVDTFLDAGFNYFDTAHGYLQGKIEECIKSILSILPAAAMTAGFCNLWLIENN